MYMSDITKEKVAKQIREHREAIGMSQYELRKQTGFNIWRIEHRYVEPTFDTVNRIADVLGVDPQDLVR